MSSWSARRRGLPPQKDQGNLGYLYQHKRAKEGGGAYGRHRACRAHPQRLLGDSISIITTMDISEEGRLVNRRLGCLDGGQMSSSIL
jgi:hypothetical protein